MKVLIQIPQLIFGGAEKVLVSFANHLRVFEPKDKDNAWHRFSTKMTKWLFQDAVTEAMMTAIFQHPKEHRQTVLCLKDLPKPVTL